MNNCFQMKIPSKFSHVLVTRSAGLWRNCGELFAENEKLSVDSLVRHCTQLNTYNMETTSFYGTLALEWVAGGAVESQEQLGKVGVLRF